MNELKNLSVTELVDKLTSSMTDLVDMQGKPYLQQLANELHTHQIELEMQNRELREAQIILEDARDRYADLYDFSPVSYITFDEKGVVRDINLTGSRMLGHMRMMIIGKPFSKWVRKEDIGLFYNHLKIVMQSDERAYGEINIITEFGQLLAVRMESIRSENITNNSYMCRSVILDITENNRIRNEITLRERQLRLITDALPLLVAYIGNNEQHQFVNKAYANWFGGSPENMLGKTICNVWGGEIYQAMSGNINTSFLGGQVTFDMDVLRDNVEKKYMTTTLIPDIDSHDQICGVILLAGDITDRVLVEERDRKKLLDLAHTSRLGAMGEMASELAHELNQPLAAVSIQSDACRRMIVSGKASQDTILNALDNISKQANRAGDVIRRIREFTSKKTLRIIETSINMLVNEAMHLLAVEFRSHRVKLELNLQNDLPSVLADKVLIEQVVFNIARNALEAMDVVNEQDRWLKVTTSVNSSGEIEVDIEDSGHGLPADKFNVIFEPFYSSKENGMGMGLAISHSIIHAHNGRLWAAGIPHGGTIFSFTLPVATEDNDNAE